MEKTDIRSNTKEELEAFLAEIGEKKYRVNQILQWIWTKNAKSFKEMTDISKKLREELDTHFYIPHLRIENKQISEDGTIKYLFYLPEGQFVEGVLIPSENRTTACLSSQTGCSLGCKFCATAGLKYKRQLTAGEIIDQFYALNHLSEEKYGKRLSNIVFMGMGEPLMNTENMLNAINIITSKEYFEFSPQRVTLSTAGLCGQIKELADRQVKFNLAISLHTANNKKRTQLMPINKSNNLDDLKDAIQYFHNKTGTRISYEYLLLKDYNDSAEDAREFAEFCKISPCKINLIEYNKVEGLPFERSTPEKTHAFISILESRNLIVYKRTSRGEDIDAACGQLANKKNNPS
ncbi:23S rRNA (adenine(2503)-C(2))-methyltransferase RlmN [Bacteroidota bacterium]